MNFESYAIHLPTPSMFKANAEQLAEHLTPELSRPAREARRSLGATKRVRLE
jgi:hypothetical protein